MSERSREQQLDELWKGYVFELLEGTSIKTDGRDRQAVGVDLLRMLRMIWEKASSQGNLDEAARAHANGRVVWHLLTNELAGWLVDQPGLPSITAAEDWTGREQGALRIAMFDDHVPPTHQGSVDPSSVLLPRWLFEELKDSLEALALGEVRPILAPSPSGRHTRPWSWEKMRAKALEHIHFLSGQGIQIGIARSRVAAATGVSANTLRDWETTSGKHARLDKAAGAGRLHVTLQNDPDYGKVGGENSLDAVEWQMLKEFRSEPLKAFGERYRSEFGQRHNQPPSAGD